jgi:3-hydroxyisobutyrate dehydrogenase
MGAAIARRLAQAGHSVTVWNRTEVKAHAVADSLPDRTIHVASRPAGAVAECDVVISMLANGAATCEVLLDSNVLAALPSGAVVCDLATSGRDVALRLATAIAAAGALFLDAPVSGSVPAVEAGTLLVMAGGEAVAVESAREVLGAVADRLVTVGSAGAGQDMKLAVNLVVHGLNAALSESLILAESAGIARERAYDVLQQSVVGAPFVHYKRAAFTDPATPVAMSLDLVAKDLGLIVDLARAVTAAVPVTDCVRRTVDDACLAGLGSADMAALSRRG